MTTVEKIRRYIERTGEKIPAAYQMNITEMLELRHMADKTPADAVCLAFEYGQAEGARAARSRKQNTQ